jgi:adenosylcobinamide-phosphate guanylyltransferase
MPLIDAEIIKKIIQLADTNKTWTTILISKDFLDSLHLKPEYTVIYEKKQYSYSGISIVNPNNLTKLKSVEESYVILDDKRIAFNLNTQEDYALLGTA